MAQFSAPCPCCGQQVEVRDAGFAATTVEVTACDRQRAAGVVSWTARKSTFAVVRTEVVRHTTGLVTFG